MTNNNVINSNNLNNSNSRLTLVEFDNLDANAQKKIKDIYNESFPKVERIDFESVLVPSTHMDKGISFFGMVDYNKPSKENIIGLSCVLNHNEMMPNLTYLLYLAIDSSIRGGGYGSAALSAVASLYPDQGVALDIETVSKLDGSEDPADRENRIRRLHFYEKNGYKFTGLTFDSEDISYDLMYSGNATVDFDAMRNYFAWLEDEIEGFVF